MAYICEKLSDQVCVLWVEQTQFLPPLSYEEATQIGLAFWALLASVWILKVIRVQVFER